MAFVSPLEPSSDRSPLAAARLRRQLTLEDAAKNAKLTPEEVSWLETGRLYRFPSSESATLALLFYATSLEIDRREARELAGLPVPPRPLDRNPVRRVAGLAAVLVLIAATAAAIVVVPGAARGGHGAVGSPATAGLPPAWKVSVDVLNGSGDIVYTRRVADRITALAYTVRSVRRADRFDYPETAVYFEPGGAALARRLASQLGVAAKPLPGGKNPRRLVVVVGPERAVS
jgi:LytR cell envelope-related transcriptional attenuator/Helix-turn-helix domain